MSKFVETVTKGVAPVVTKFGTKAPLIGAAVLLTGGAGLGGYFTVRHFRKKRMERAVESHFENEEKEDK